MLCDDWGRSARWRRSHGGPAGAVPMGGVTTATASPRPFRLGYPGRPPRECDLLVIGGGLVGLAVARELTRRHEDAKVVVLEREPQLAMHQSGNSSGVIHAGIYYAPGSLKARLCVRGAALLEALCAQHGVPVERCGKLIVARDAGELARLDELERRGRANGVPGLRRIAGGEIAEHEPHAIGVAALHSPRTGIVDFRRVAAALAADVRARGGEVVLGCAVESVVPVGGDARLSHAGGVLQAGTAICCAGAWSDRLAVAGGGSPDPRIMPFRGQYLRLAPHARRLVRGLIYPVPDPSLPFLGVHLTRHIAGEVLLGPSALLVGARDAYRLARLRARDALDTLTWPGTWRMLWRWRAAALDELRMAASRRAFVERCRAYVPELTVADVELGPAGVRAQALTRDGSLVDDFVVEQVGAILHVRNAPSPAATASLAIAELIADRAGIARGG